MMDESALANIQRRETTGSLALARGILPGTNMIEHQFPLRAGLMVKLTLPADLTKK